MKRERFRDAIAATVGRRLAGLAFLLLVVVLVGEAAKVALS